ncbi:MAG TPA: phosphatidate cytidylyltransferase [Oxalicibacterium sp.]|nr:phosphatidate cytidylyltransferase [Oxalicibacterium sp.]
MLKTRIITAVVLLAVLLLAILSGSLYVFAALVILFFAGAAWEALRLSQNRYAVAGALVWSAALVWVIFSGSFRQSVLLCGLCAGLWVVRLVPSLKIGLPPLQGFGNRLLTGIYGVAILGAFIALMMLYQRSVLYMFSVMAIVWIADIGAYFCGKAFGKRKLAPSISPGKSWEGAIGGCFAVLIIGAATVFVPALRDTFAVQLYLKWNWLGLIAGLVVMVAASVVGDLFESQLKRRAGMKDSSNLLPGHGGVLDRIDALIPTLPLAVLIAYWM